MNMTVASNDSFSFLVLFSESMDQRAFDAGELSVSFVSVLSHAMPIAGRCRGGHVNSSMMGEPRDPHPHHTDQPANDYIR